MAARFWVGGTGNWDASTTTHWSTTSGGTGGAAVPTSSDAVTFDSNSGTSATVTITAAANASAVTINKSDLTLLHNAGSTVVGVMTLTAGTLNTNGQTCSWGDFSSNNSNARTLTMGASQITLTATGNGTWNTATISNLTVTANTATIQNVSGSSPSSFTWMNAGSLNFNGASITLFPGGGSIGIGGSITCATLTVTGGAGKLGICGFVNNITCTTFVTTGNSLTNRILVESTGLGSQVTITAGTTTLSNTDFMDVKGAGAGSWSGTSLGNCLGCSGITFTVAVTRYAVTAGNFSSTAVWSTSSGGSTGASVPLPQDTVNLDANSGAGTYVIDTPRTGAVNCTGFTRTLTNTTVNSSVFGNLLLVSGMTWSSTAFLTLAGRGSQTLTTGGKAFGGTLQISAPGGTYTFQDSFNPTNVTLTAGTLNDGGHSYTYSGTFTSNSTLTRTATLSGTWTCSGATPLTITTSGQTWTASSASFVLSNAAPTFAGAGLTFGTVWLTTAATLTISGSNTITNLILTAGCTVKFTAATTQTITSLTATGSSGSKITLNSTTGGSTWTVSCASGTISCDWLILQDSTATGGASFYAGANSTSTSNNSGWKFTAVPTDTPSGSIAAGGSRTEAKTGTDSQTGSVATGGTSTDSKVGADSPAGSLTTGGSSSDARTGSDAPAGTLATNGTRTEGVTFTVAPTGSIIVSGTSVELEGETSTPIGSILVRGTTAEAWSNSTSMVGSIIVGGSRTEGSTGSDTCSGSSTLAGVSIDAHVGTVTVTGSLFESGTLVEHYTPGPHAVPIVHSAAGDTAATWSYATDTATITGNAGDTLATVSYATDTPATYAAAGEVLDDPAYAGDNP